MWHKIKACFIDRLSDSKIPCCFAEKKADEIKSRNDAAKRIEDVIGRRGRSRSGSRDRRRSRSPRRRSRSPGRGFGSRFSRRSRSRSPRGGGGSKKSSNHEPLGQPAPPAATSKASPVVEKAQPDSTIDPVPTPQQQLAAVVSASASSHMRKEDIEVSVLLNEL